MEMFEKVVLKCDACGDRRSKQLDFDKGNMTLTCKTCGSIFTLLDKTDNPDELRKLIEQQSCDNKEAYERLVAMYNEQKDKTGEVVLKIDTAIGYISDIKSDLQKLHQEVASQGEDLKKLNQKATSQGEDLKKLNQKATSQGEDLKRLNQKAFVQGEEIKKQGIKIDGVVSRFDQETDNLRTLLREAMSEQYVSGEKIKDIAKDLLTKDGNDFLANFCNAVYSDNAQKVNVFLDKIDEKQDKSDVELIIKFLINDLDSKNVSSLEFLVKRLNLQLKYLDKIEEEAEKVSEGIYNPMLKRDIFVAFAGADEDRVVPIVNYFDEQGFECFFSLRNLRHGKNAQEVYWSEIKEALSNCFCLVFMSSNNSRKSTCDALKELKYISDELNRKHKMGIGMFEYILDEYTDKTPNLIKNTLKKYFDNRSYYTDIDVLCERLFDYKQEKEVNDLFVSDSNDNIVKEDAEVAATIEKGVKTADLSEANTKESNNTEIIKTNVSPVPKITLSNYDKDEFEIEGTELVESKGNKSKEFENFILKCDTCGARNYKDFEFDKENLTWTCRVCRSTFSLLDKTDKPDELRKLIEQQFRDNKEAYERLFDYKQEKKVNDLFNRNSNNSIDKKEAEVAATIEKGNKTADLSEANTKESNNTEIIKTNVSPVPKITLSNYDKDEFKIEGTELVTYKGNKSKVVIPDGVTSIGWFAFKGCKSLTSIVIPSSVVSIANSAFDENSHTRHVSSGAFYGCSNLTSIIVESSNQKYKSEGNCIIEKDTNKLVLGCKNSVIPNYVEKIESSAFSGCSSLTTIEIPNGVEEIGEEAFKECSSLISIGIPNSVIWIDNEAFAGCSSLTSIELPNSVEEIEYSAFAGCSSLTSIELPNSVEEIEYSAFAGCSSLTSIVIPSSVTSIGEYAFSDCSSLTSVVIPSSVTSIGEEAFADCSSLTSIVMHNGVENIGDEAFKGCSSLTSIELPNSVEEIEYSAFAGCSSLTSVEIPSSVTSIDQYAFSGCSSLTSIVIPSSVEYIGDNAFKGCESLTIYCETTEEPDEWETDWNSSNRPVNWGCKKNNSIQSSIIDLLRVLKQVQIKLVSKDIKALLSKLSNIVYDKNEFDIEGTELVKYKGNKSEVAIPEGVTSIGDNSFSVCTRLASIKMPSSVTSIGYGAFYGCRCLTSVAIPRSVTSIGEKAFYGCSSLTNIEIPSSVESIGFRAFYGCRSLISIWIPSSVKSISWGAFKDCYNLTIYCELTKKPSGWDVNWNSSDRPIKWGCKKNNCIQSSKTATAKEATQKQTQKISEKTKSVSKVTLSNYDKNEFEIEGTKLVKSKANKTEVSIPEGVTSIGDYAFFRCSSLTSIVIPSSVTSIGEYAFSDCSSLTSVVIPSSVTSIGEEAFADCSSLTSVEIPSSVTNIGEKAFYDCKRLASIKIPSSVTSIGDYAFRCCSSLASIIVDARNPKYKSDGNCIIEKDTNNLVLGCKNSVIPNYVKSIGKYAFLYCICLTSIEIPSSVTSIDEGAFINCSGLSSIIVASSNPKYKSDGNCIIEKGTNKMVLGCKNSVIPNYVKSIGNGAFHGCSSLTSIELPNSVEEIEYSAFAGCSSLTSIVIPRSVTTISRYAFSLCFSLKRIKYKGTKRSWKAINHYDSGLQRKGCTIYCAIGKIEC